MTIKAVIIDDEQNNIDNLEILLQQYCPQVTVVGNSLDATDGENMIMHEDPDLVFLDIRMPGKNGFELLQSLHTYSFELIFLTASDQYGIEAVKFAAIDYLVKPINTEELKLAVNKAIYRSRQKKQNKQLENLVEILEQRKDSHRIALPGTKETRFIKTNEIIRCESSNNYTTFFIKGGERILTSQPISGYEEILKSYGFIRCHQSHLVNKKYIKSLVKEDGDFILLENNTQVPVSRLKKDLIRAELERN